MALDGGCLEPTRPSLAHRTAWAVVSIDGALVCGATLTGPDQAAACAERTALWHAVTAAPSWLRIKRSCAACSGASLGPLRAMLRSSGTNFWTDGALLPVLPGYLRMVSSQIGLRPLTFLMQRRAVAPMLLLMLRSLASWPLFVCLCNNATAGMQLATNWAKSCHTAQRAATLPFWEACKTAWSSFDSWRN